MQPPRPSPSGRARVSVRFRAGPPTQAALRFPARRASAARLGELALGRWPQLRAVDVIVHDNRVTLWSARASGPALRLGIHFSLLDQEQDLAAALTARDQDAANRLMIYFRAWQDARVEEGIHRAPPALSGRGEHHDLDEMFDQQNKVHFEGRISATIGWGRSASRGPARRIRLGSCGGSPPIIRVHPVLDSDQVPAAFVRFIVFHEMLHVSMPPRATGGARRSVHPPAFRSAERKHPDWAFAADWEEDHIHWLFERARRLSAEP